MVELGDQGVVGPTPGANALEGLCFSVTSYLVFKKCHY